VNFIDSQGSAQLHELIELSGANGISLRLARVKPQVLEVLARDGVIDSLGADHIHTSVNDAVETHLGLAQRTPA
jgi:sulfate permease, SulP family